MKVLHLWVSTTAGGGGIIMNRLHLALKQAGVDSKILCKSVAGEDPDQIRLASKLERLERTLERFTRKLGLNDIHRLSSFALPRHESLRGVDVIHIHGIHSGFFSYLALPTLTRSKPTVFTLHDMWPLTGHCTISLDCERWKTGCGKCPYPKSYPPMARDSSHLEWKLKDWSYHNSHLTIISPSSRYAQFAAESMLNRYVIHHIPHGIDTAVYAPLDKKACRSLLNISAGKKVLMFAAMDLNAFGKGGDLLTRSLSDLPADIKRDLLVVTLGRSNRGIAKESGIPELHLGYLSNDRLLAMAYSTADLFVSPTRGEAFGLTLQESMACGTPMVSFNVGGVPDLVRHGITGYLAEAGQHGSLTQGISEILRNDQLRERMSGECRKIAVEEYALEKFIRRHMDLYAKAIDTFTSHGRAERKGHSDQAIGRNVAAFLAA